MILHILVGALNIIFVSWCLRWELKPIYEKLLRICENILIKIFKSKNDSKNSFSNIWLVNKIHKILYGNISSDKMKEN